MKTKLISLFMTVILFVCLVSCGAGNMGETATLYESVSSENEFVSAEKENVCSLVIDCSTVFAHLDLLDPAVAEYLPEDGMILSQTVFSFESGETVAGLLRRVCDENGIALETAGVSGSLYVKGIGHLYEFDCGSGSGWLYRVNGDFPNYGCGSFILSPGDSVEWIYTCDLGSDVGDTDTDTFH